MKDTILLVTTLFSCADEHLCEQPFWNIVVVMIDLDDFRITELRVGLLTLHSLSMIVLENWATQSKNYK